MLVGCPNPSWPLQPLQIPAPGTASLPPLPRLGWLTRQQQTQLAKVVPAGSHSGQPPAPTPEQTLAHQTTLTAKQIKRWPLAAPNRTPSHLAKQAGSMEALAGARKQPEHEPIGKTQGAAHKPKCHCASVSPPASRRQTGPSWPIGGPRWLIPPKRMLHSFSPSPFANSAQTFCRTYHVVSPWYPRKDYLDAL